MTQSADNDARAEALARLLLRAVLDDFEAEFIESEGATPWRNALLQARAVLTAGYVISPASSEREPVTLTDFLLARIAEDEGWAKAARGWQTGSRHEGQPLDWSIHMDRWSPDRVLAECEAKRRIVEWHGERDDCCEERYGPMVFDDEPELSAGVDSLGQLTMRQSLGYEPFIGCVTLMHLALPYADHPDYREEWKP